MSGKGNLGSARFPALPVESIGFDKLAANYPASSSSHRSAFGRADESSAHTAVFFVVSGCVLYALLCGIVGRCIAGAGYVGDCGALELICGRPVHHWFSPNDRS